MLPFAVLDGTDTEVKLLVLALLTQKLHTSLKVRASQCFVSTEIMYTVFRWVPGGMKYTVHKRTVYFSVLLFPSFWLRAVFWEIFSEPIL